MGKQVKLIKGFVLFFLLFLVELVGVAEDQITFKKREMQIGSTRILVEIADNDLRRSRGLMFRKSLSEDQGMIFIFPQAQTLSFWMKNTLVPLSIGFFDQNRVLFEIKNMEPMKSVMQINWPQYTSSRLAQYALEMNLGWFEKNKIRPGVQWNWIKQEK